MALFAQVVVQGRAFSGAREYTYSLPDFLAKRIAVGTQVVVPFGKAWALGYVVGVGEQAPGFPVKDVFAVVEEQDKVAPHLVELAGWISDYYLCTPGAALRLVLPPGEPRTVRLKYQATGEALDPGVWFGRGALATEILQYLLSRRGLVALSVLEKRVGRRGVSAALAGLVEDGLAEQRVEVTKPRAAGRRVQRLRLTPAGRERAGSPVRTGPKQAAILAALVRLGGEAERAVLEQECGRIARPSVNSLVKSGLVTLEEGEQPPPSTAGAIPPRTPADSIQLTPDQQAALAAIARSLDGSPGQFLLSGVTASGKTEVYLRAIREALARGRSAILLVPEIALTPQAMGQLKERFGDNVAILHSRLATGERLHQWRKAASGAAKVAVGPRSALFCGVHNLGLVVVDEEHEASYKSERAPCYDARTVAWELCRRTSATLVFGSATPSVEAYYLAERGGLQVLTLHGRVDGAPLPPVQVVDMRHESPQNRKRQLSDLLFNYLQETFAAGEQTILFLNRRGFSTFGMCYRCGNIMKCPNCAVGLVFHRARRMFRCHHCDYSEPAGDQCPVCKGLTVEFHGTGTERVESTMAESFPQARLVRVDRDTVARRGMLPRLLGQFAEGEGDVLIGTQMIGRGLDFGRVSLVGVVNADTPLALPDFRASERTFQMLTQVAGRAGRGGTPGRVIVQSYNAEHPSIQAATAHDHPGFCKTELRERRKWHYPPYVRLINIVFSDVDASKAQAAGAEVAVHLREVLGNAGVVSEVIGPAAAPLQRVAGKWRWHVLVKCAKVEETTPLVRQVLEAQAGRLRTPATVDVDPTSVL